ncbi:MAG: GTPase domain-containing protein [Planctomycetes bacterium]|nr:GTPase domain-containing protein [Planctomycetota bacterium]
MVQINFALKEVNCKVVFYGPGMSGKTTNLEVVHQKVPEENKGELTSISTDGDRTLFFDFMPLDLGNIAGMRTKFQLYTVPGQVYYNSTRKLVLQGVDGVIFVADSDPDKMAENIESYENLVENLKEYGKDIRDVPHVIQYNKRDLPNAMPVEEMDKQMNRFGVPTFEAVARTGEGVFPTLKVLAEMVLESIEKADARRPAGRPAGDKPKAPAARPAAAGARPAAAGATAAARPAAPAAPRAQGGAKHAAGAAPAPAGRPAAAARPAAARSATARTSPSKAVAKQPAAAAAAATGKKKGAMGVVLSLVVLLAAAAAGVVYFYMNGQK